MSVDNQALVGPQTLADGSENRLRSGRTGEQIVSELNGRYYEQAFRKNLFWAHAIVTAPVIYTTAAGTGGPLLYNPVGSNVNAVLLGVGFGVSVVTTVAASLGITGGPTTAPSSTTAIDSRTNAFIGGPSSVCTPYRVGTVSAAGTFFLPFADLHTGALTVDNRGVSWIDLGGSVIVPPGYFASVAASATASTTVASISLLYAELAV